MNMQSFSSRLMTLLSPRMREKSELDREVKKLLALTESESHPWRTESEIRARADEVSDSDQCQLSDFERHRRAVWLGQICGIVDELLADHETVSIHEPGCGYCLNLAFLHDKYQKRVVLSGTDISSCHLDVARDRLEFDAETWCASIDDADAMRGASIVFTVGALLWADNPERVIGRMCQLADHAVVLVEPTWEQASKLQRTYLLRTPYAKNILGSAQNIGVPTTVEPCAIPFSSKLPVSVIVLRTDGAA